MPDRGIDMNSVVTNEQCEERIQSVVKTFGFTCRINFVEDSTWCGWIQGYVFDVATMNLSGDLVQSKCEVTETNVVDLWAESRE